MVEKQKLICICTQIHLQKIYLRLRLFICPCVSVGGTCVHVRVLSVGRRAEAFTGHEPSFPQLYGPCK